MNEVCTSYGSTPSVYRSRPTPPQNRIEKVHTQHVRHSRGASWNLEIHDCVFYRALKAGAQQSLPVLYEGNSDFQFRFDDRTTLNRY